MKGALALLMAILLVSISGAIVLAAAFVWQGLGQRELSGNSMLLAWPIAAIVGCAVFIPLGILDSRRHPVVEIRRGDPPPVDSASAPSLAPFGLAVVASVVAVLVLWTSNLGD